MPRIDDDGGRGRGPEWKLDVFVSFRGDELRNNFASHLFKALRDAGIECFRDDDEWEIGKKLNPKLVDGIQRSRVSLALFSPRFMFFFFFFFLKSREGNELVGKLTASSFFD